MLNDECRSAAEIPTCREQMTRVPRATKRDKIEQSATDLTLSRGGLPNGECSTGRLFSCIGPPTTIDSFPFSQIGQKRTKRARLGCHLSRLCESSRAVESRWIEQDDRKRTNHYALFTIHCAGRAARHRNTPNLFHLLRRILAIHFR